MLVNLAEIKKFWLARNYHFEEQFPLSLWGEEITFSPVIADIYISCCGFANEGSIRTGLFKKLAAGVLVSGLSGQIQFEIPYVHQDDLNEIGIQVEPVKI